MNGLLLDKICYLALKGFVKTGSVAGASLDTLRDLEHVGYLIKSSEGLYRVGPGGYYAIHVYEKRQH